MARLPADELAIIKDFGPHLSGKVRGKTTDEVDSLVKTHCCFCGQQCGIQLKVRNNEVIGFEPWMEFPFNRGMLCPKGVKRYLQGSHPDRLLTALRRDPSAPAGFSPMAYDEAAATVARELGRLQDKHGPASVGVLGGASLTTEKTYLLGKFARVCLKTPYIDYNGRLCMVSAGAGNKKAFGVDRVTSPWADMIGTEVIWVAGSNVSDCSPITTNYLWQAREKGAKLIVQDPRITPIARTVDLFLPVKPGRDAALFAGVLKLMIDQGWIDQGFIDKNTVDFDKVVDHCRTWTLERTAEVTGVPKASITRAAELWGQAKSSFFLHARGIEHHSNGVNNVLGAINLVLASGRIGNGKSGYGTIVGQANGQGGREHGQKCDQLPGMRDISNPEHREYIASVWGVDESSIPGPGVDAYEMFRKIDAGEIKGLLAICFNPKVSLPDSGLVTRALEKLEFFAAIDFFLNDTAWHADIVLPGSLQEEDQGTVTQVEGRVIKINKAVDCPGEAREDWVILQDIARLMGRPHGFTFASPGEIFDELCAASKGSIADYSAITYEKLEANMGVFWPCPSEDPASKALTPDHPGTPRLFLPGSYNPIAKGAGPFYFPDGKARFNVADYRAPVDDASEDYPLYLTTGRVVSQFLSGTQTRRIGPLVKQYPEPRIELHPRLAAKLGIADRDWTVCETPRGSITLRALVVTTIRPDTVFVPYHWPGRKSINRLTVAAQDPVSKIPQYKVCGCRVRKADGEPEYASQLEPQQ
jgi:assimilatory nitrate reductase catalytic subunit